MYLGRVCDRNVGCWPTLGFDNALLSPLLGHLSWCVGLLRPFVLVNIGCSTLGYSILLFFFLGLICSCDIFRVPSVLLGFLLGFHLVGHLVSSWLEIHFDSWNIILYMVGRWRYIACSC